MNLSTLLRRASLACAAIMAGLTSQAAEVTLNGFTTVGESKAIQVTYALNKTDKVARVRRVDDTSTSDKKRKSCVIPQTITVDKVKYTVKYIGTGAFSHITDGFDPLPNDKNACKFQRVELPNTITEIGERAFLCMSTLKNCNIPTSVQIIHPFAFMKSGLESATIPASCTVIGASAFDKSALKSISFAEGSNSLGIGTWAFNKTKITSLTTPKRLNAIYFNAFYDCAALTDVTLNGTFTEIPEHCFTGCESILRFTCNAPITTIGHNAFSNGMDNLQSFKINSNALRTIESYAFNRTGITSAGPEILKEGMIFISQGLFSDCPKFTSVVIPTTVMKIGLDAFDNSPNLRRIDCYTAVPPEINNLLTFTEETFKNADVNVRPELAPMFSRADYWRSFNWSKYGIGATDDIPVDDYDPSQPVEYYNLQGMRVDADALTPGIYIRRHGGKSEKIAIR